MTDYIASRWMPRRNRWIHRDEKREKRIASFSTVWKMCLLATLCRLALIHSAVWIFLMWQKTYFCQWKSITESTRMLFAFSTQWTCCDKNYSWRLCLSLPLYIRVDFFCEKYKAKNTLEVIQCYKIIKLYFVIIFKLFLWQILIESCYFM